MHARVQYPADIEPLVQFIEETPRSEILEFAQSTYAAGAKLAGWDQASLERKLAPNF